MDGSHGKILFSSVSRIQMPFSDADSVRGRASVSEAMSGAKDPRAADQSSAANVLTSASTDHLKRNLVGEFAFAGRLASDDVGRVIGPALLDLLGGANGCQSH